MISTTCDECNGVIYPDELIFCTRCLTKMQEEVTRLTLYVEKLEQLLNGKEDGI